MAGPADHVRIAAVQMVSGPEVAPNLAAAGRLIEAAARAGAKLVAMESPFVAMRTQRDATLSMPKLILPSLQINMRAGRMPEPEANGTRYLKLPLNTL